MTCLVNGKGIHYGQTAITTTVSAIEVMVKVLGFLYEFHIITREHNKRLLNFNETFYIHDSGLY